ncbi:MAG: leucine-rich repeat domain-containing protein [Muribaculaceae bacterium]|nr:leucine-rich repeat domain-containing protein [Muribaculaceae bacterium]
MKKISFIVTTMLSFLTMTAKDFEYRRIIYTIISETEKTCTMKEGWWSQSCPLKGHFDIIEEVFDEDGTKFTVTEIGPDVFRGTYNSIDAISIPYTITKIGDRAFYECGLRGGVKLPKSLKEIGEQAFYMTNISLIEIPSSVEKIGFRAFGYCTKLKEICINENNSSYCSVDGVLYDKKKTKLIQVPGARNGSFTIPESICDITGAFEGCEYITSVTLPNSIQGIGDFAFRYCGLNTIEIPSSVTKIGNHAFEHCDFLTTITLPESITEIGSSAFEHCDYLTTITLPESITEIGSSAFDSCHNLTTLNIPPFITEIKENTFRYCYSLNPITLPKNLVKIESGAFMGCKSLRTLELPNSITKIGPSAFDSCKNLSSINIPDSITEIEERVFASCNLTISIPKSIKKIGAEAFYYHDMSTVTIPEYIEEIGTNAFAGPNLQEILVDEGNMHYTSIDGVLFNKDISELLQYPCGRGGEYIVPNTVKKLLGAFGHCEKIRSVTLPKGIMQIDEHSFFLCIYLRDIYYPAENPVEVGPPEIFDNKRWWWDQTILYVPQEAVEKCRSLSPWSCLRIRPFDFSGLTDVTIDCNNESDIEVFNLNGLKISNSTVGLPKGVYIIRQGNKTEKVIVQ